MPINPPIAWLLLLTLASGCGPASVSPDDTQPAFVSFRKTLMTNGWLLNLKTRKLVNLTASLTNPGDRLKPHSYFRRDGKGTG